MATWKQTIDTACPVCGVESVPCVGPDGGKLLLVFHLERKAEAEAKVAANRARWERRWKPVKRVAYGIRVLAGILRMFSPGG